MAKYASEASYRAKAMHRFVAMTKPTYGCWLWGGTVMNSGYGSFYFHKTMAAHRAAWLLFRGEIPANSFVCHTCDNRLCVYPGHLWLGTHAENMADMVKKGRHDPNGCEPVNRARGARHGSAKLTDDAVAKIRSLFADGTPQKDIAATFGVSVPTVSAVCTRRVWRHV